MSVLTTSWQFWAVLAAIFAAATAILAKLGVSQINPNLATFLRTLVVAVALGALVWSTGQTGGMWSMSTSTAVYLVLSGLATGASWLCYFHALKIGKAAQVAPVDKLSVVFVAILGATFLGETLSAGAWAGIVMIASGAMLVALG